MLLHTTEANHFKVRRRPILPAVGIRHGDRYRPFCFDIDLDVAAIRAESIAGIVGSAIESHSLFIRGNPMKDTIMRRLRKIAFVDAGPVIVLNVNVIRGEELAAVAPKHETYPGFYGIRCVLRVSIAIMIMVLPVDDLANSRKGTALTAII